MNEKEFYKWLDGFIDALGDHPPTDAQWSKILEKMGKVQVNNNEPNDKALEDAIEKVKRDRTRWPPFPDDGGIPVNPWDKPKIISGGTLEDQYPDVVLYNIEGVSQGPNGKV